MWQADHTPLDVWLLDEEGKPAKPYLTAIEDDYSRMIVGYRLSFQTATALTTALTLRQAIWRKEDPRWSACGIPYSADLSNRSASQLETFWLLTKHAVQFHDVLACVFAKGRSDARQARTLVCACVSMLPAASCVPPRNKNVPLSNY